MRMQAVSTVQADRQAAPQVSPESNAILVTQEVHDAQDLPNGISASSSASDPDSDASLLTRVRTGDREAFARLWQRNIGTARAVAWRYSGLADPEDTIQEASRMLLATLLRGGGPYGEFRPYLAVTIRNAAISLSRRAVPEPVGDINELAGLANVMTSDSSTSALEGLVMARAFKSLPQRWQQVLWYVTVEDLSTSEAGVLLGLSPNATAALAKRARHGLRTAWLESHVDNEAYGPACRDRSKYYFPLVQGTLDGEELRITQLHVSRCQVCPELISEIHASLRSRTHHR